MSIKIKHILLLVLIILLSIIVLIVISYKELTSKYNNNVEAENIEKNCDMYYARGGDGWLEVCYLVAQKNGNWDNLFLSENFRKKYNEKDGILGDLQYDSIEYRPYAGSNEDYYFKEDMTYFVITQGKSKTVYKFHPVYLDNNQLDDVQFSEIIQLYDKNGNRISVGGETIDKDSFEYSFFKLCIGGDDEKRIAVTDNFHRKYPFFLDIFEHYSPLTYNLIEFVSERSSWDRKEAYFIVDSKLECKKRHYKVKFTIDSRGYLDDVEVKKVNEVEYESTDEYRSVKLLYPNSNWQNLEITDNYKKSM